MLTIDITRTSDTVQIDAFTWEIWKGRTDRGVPCFALLLGGTSSWFASEGRLWITPTDIVFHDRRPPYRVWKAATRFDVRGSVFVHRIAVNADKDQAEFLRELDESVSPGKTVEDALHRQEIFGPIDARLLLP